MIAGAAIVAGLLAVRPRHNFTIYSEPVRLRYGQVHNRIQGDEGAGFPLPDDVVRRYRERTSEDGPNTGSMTIVGYSTDLVRRDAAGRETPVPLYDFYNHHYNLHLGGRASISALEKAVKGHSHVLDMQGHGLRKLRKAAAATDPIQWAEFSGASGAEYRHNPHQFPSPFGTVIYAPEVFAFELHLIKTMPPNGTFNGTYSPLLECPCTPQRRIDPAAGTVDGEVPFPPFGCSAAMHAAGNTACSLETYTGGWRCCEHGVMVIDTAQCADSKCSEFPQEEVFFKMTIEFEDADENTLPLTFQECCDVTSDHTGDGNVEYDIPACPPGTPSDQCVHVFDSVQPMHYFDPNRTIVLRNGSVIEEGDLEVDLVYASAHIHAAGISLEMIDAVTNETLCAASRKNGVVRYGTSDAAGDERGYLVAIQPCVWGKEVPPPRRRRSHPIRTRAVYNATRGHTGVMALWLNMVHELSV